MNRKWMTVLIAALIVCIPVSYMLGRNSIETKEETDSIATLYELNRAELEKLIFIEGPTYVIGHKSPDSDTVCSAIGFAALLNKLGINAEARVAGDINNETKYILEEAGAEVPEILYDATGYNIFLVDHSEYAQAVEGLIDANIVGVIDHHGIGTINVGHQVLYNAKPIGATATSVWLSYMNYGVEIDPLIARILLGAILSDTANLTASTTISADEKAVKAFEDVEPVLAIEL